VQREILGTTSTGKLRVYAVWVPFLGGTQASADLSQRVLPDPRVVQFWDGAALTSDWFAKNVDHSPGLAWDVYYLYGPGASWTNVPGPLVSSGGTIIGQSSQLEQAISPLLKASSAA
jgi:hypothetical protein